MELLVKKKGVGTFNTWDEDSMVCGSGDEDIGYT
jgi:hypothetical protein